MSRPAPPSVSAADGRPARRPAPAPGRLLVVNTTNRRRGAEVRSIRIASGLARRGWQVEVVSLTAEPDGPTVAAEPLTGVSPASLGTLTPEVLAALRHRLRRGSHGLVLANGSATLRYVATASLGVVARRRLGYVAIGEPRYWARTRRRRLRQRLWLRRFGWAIAVSEETARQLRSLVGPRLPIDVAHAGVPDELFTVRRGPRAGALRILVLGSLTPEKDPLAALEVVRRAGGGATVEMRFVGSGPLEAAVAARAGETGLADVVELRGTRVDAAGELAWAHVLMSTSRTEGLPGAVVEAAASGIPVLAFDVGGTREVVEHGVTGALLPPGDVGAMADALRRLADDEELRLRWGEAARSHARARFTVARTIDAYDRILRARSRW